MRWLPSIFLFLSAAFRAAGAPLSFERDVAPILNGHCADCHGGRVTKGELELTSAAGLVRGGESGPAFVSGEPEKSLLFEMIHQGEMPKKGEKLTERQSETIREWIGGGARFENPPAIAEAKTNQHDVLPILLLRCAACHGRQVREGRLDLRTVAGMFAGGESGPAFVAGEPDASLLIRRIESEACPPREKLLKFFVKRPPGSELKILREWIANGAPVEAIEPDVANGKPDPLVTEEDRSHWAFRGPVKPATGDSIDFFVERRLRELGLDFSPEANRDTLIRRAYLDLIGMPPPVDEWKRWRESGEPDWFAEMVDSLLASPHYGERWGRYWLDLAGYADSEGGLSSDPLREVAWKYRDYVVRAFNEDKPYDRFLLEQIAGDELLDYENAERITGEMVENLVATGFLRMGIDQTGSRTMNFVEDRIGVIADVIDVLGSGVMGLTMECVRCHSHKYDPIPQRDYYRLKAVFQGALDEHDWLSFKQRSLEVATPVRRERAGRINPPLERRLRDLRSQRREAEVAWQREMLRSRYPEQSTEERDATFVALRRADNTRTQEQRLLVEKLQVAMLIPDSLQSGKVRRAKSILEDLDRQIDETRAGMEPPPMIRALWDRGEPSPTYILRRGETTSPGRLVGPGVPSVLTDGMSPFAVSPPFPGKSGKTGRRLAFARWLVDRSHPLTARVMVNRIWNHHFGAGLVETLENFGIQGEEPSHPELLDWLAVEFMERAWSIKEMHRLILNSRTWRQSSRVSEEARQRDPRNRHLSRMPLRRLDAEAIRDSLLLVSGKIDRTMGGPPIGVEMDREGFIQVKAGPDGTWRRSLYSQYRRTELPSMMETFDYPEMGPNCVSRTVSTVSPQSLLLMNNARIRALAAALARRVEEEASEEPGNRVETVYRIALSRNPTPEEKRLGMKALGEMEAAWDAAGALQAYCHTILNSAGFVYVD